MALFLKEISKQINIIGRGLSSVSVVSTPREPALQNNSLLDTQPSFVLTQTNLGVPGYRCNQQRIYPTSRQSPSNQKGYHHPQQRKIRTNKKTRIKFKTILYTSHHSFKRKAKDNFISSKFLRHRFIFFGP